MLGNTCVVLETLRRVLSEVEATVNDRPLTYVSTDFADPSPISPSQLLCGRRITTLPYPRDLAENSMCESRTKSQLNTHFTRRCNLIYHFSNRWKLEYLTSLREYHRHTGNNRQEIKVGDVVQIHNDTHRNQWKLGIIDKLFTGEDNRVRTVKDSSRVHEPSDSKTLTTGNLCNRSNFSREKTR